MRIREILREGSLRSRIEALSFGMRSGRLSPVDVFRETRFKQGYSKNQGILVEPLGETPLVQARSSEKRYLNDEQFGLLDGIPFGVLAFCVEKFSTLRGRILGVLTGRPQKALNPGNHESIGYSTISTKSAKQT